MKRRGTWRRPARLGVAIAAVLAVFALVACNPADQYPRRVPPGTDAGHWFVFHNLNGTVWLGNGDAPKPIALTFDDGPGPSTDALVDILANKHVPATFFIVGRQVAGREHTLEHITEWGNRLGSHSWTHSYLTHLSSSDRARELDWSLDVLTPYLHGDNARCVRPPYGDTNSAVHTDIAARGKGEILWSIDPSDYQNPPASVIADRVVNAAFPGAIILMHDGPVSRPNTLAAVPQIIDRLHAQGYTFVSVC